MTCDEAANRARRSKLPDGCTNEWQQFERTHRHTQAGLRLIQHDTSAAFAVECVGEVIDVGDNGYRIGVRRLADEIDRGFNLGSHRAGTKLAGVQVASASSAVICLSCCSSGLPKLMHAYSTAVRITSVGASRWRARRPVVRSLSMTAATPRTRPIGIDGDRNAAAAAADDDLPRVDETFDRRHLDDLARQWRRDDAAETAFTFVADLPAVVRAMRLRPALR